MKSKPTQTVKPLISQLAVQIIEQVRSENRGEGMHLVEQALADAFRVSRSPVREALRILERKAIVVFRPRRGFFLARPAAQIPNLDIEVPVSTEEEKYRQIAEDRVRGKLHGHVSETELMSRYGISRVKLMKVLMRMSQEGWVERRPGHGWTFPSILETVEALDQGYRFRMLIEPSALLEPTFRVDPVLFARLRKEQEDLLASPIDGTMPFRMYETGARFHEQLLSCSGNRFFLESIQHINRLRRLIEYSLRVDESRLSRYWEHIEIMTMLEQGRRTTAAALLRDHIDQARVKKTSAPETNIR